MFTQRRVALRFRSTTFRKLGRVATAKVTFSNKSAPVLCKRNAVLLLFSAVLLLFSAVFRPILKQSILIQNTVHCQRRFAKQRVISDLSTFFQYTLYNRKTVFVSSRLNLSTSTALKHLGWKSLLKRILNSMFCGDIQVEYMYECQECVDRDMF